MTVRITGLLTTNSFIDVNVRSRLPALHRCLFNSTALQRGDSTKQKDQIFDP